MQINIKTYLFATLLIPVGYDLFATSVTIASGVISLY